MPSDQSGSQTWLAIVIGALGSAALALTKYWPRHKREIEEHAVGLEGIIQGGAERMLDRYERRIESLEKANQSQREEIDRIKLVMLEASQRHMEEKESLQDEAEDLRCQVNALRIEIEVLRKQVNGGAKKT